MTITGSSTCRGGEYESEIERGGEVALEQFWLQKAFNRYAIIRAGMQVIPVGALNAHHESTEYFGVYRNEGEFTIIPSTWHEVAWVRRRTDGITRRCFCPVWIATVSTARIG